MHLLGGIDSSACFVRDGPWLRSSFREWHEERWAAGTPGGWVSDWKMLSNHDGVMCTCLYPPFSGTLETIDYYEYWYEHYTTRGRHHPYWWHCFKFLYWGRIWCLHIVLAFFVLSVMINSCFIPCNSRLQKLLSLPGKRKELSCTALVTWQHLFPNCVIHVSCKSHHQALICKVLHITTGCPYRNLLLSLIDVTYQKQKRECVIHCALWLIFGTQGVCTVL